MEINYHTFPKSGKSYAFVVGPNNSRIFLRNILFLTRAANPSEIAIVHSWGEHPTRGSWEPPKGQMEWKELSAAGFKPGQRISRAQLVSQQRLGVLRELTEEAKILPSEIRGLKPLPFAYKQAWPESGLTNAFFIYQFWEATADDKQLFEAQKRLAELVAHPDWRLMLPKDNSEKDAIKWFEPRRDGLELLYGSFSKKMTRLYFKVFKGYHDV